MGKGKYEKFNYSFICECGHDVTVSIGGYSEYYRQEVANKIAHEPCDVCKTLQEEKELEKKYNRKLADLKGSEKQIKWGRSIRKNLINSCDEDKLDTLFSIDNAKVFIDGREAENGNVFAIRYIAERYANENTERVMLDNNFTVDLTICSDRYKSYSPFKKYNIRARQVAKLDGVRQFYSDEVIDMCIKFLRRKCNNANFIIENENTDVDVLISRIRTVYNDYKLH